MPETSSARGFQKKGTTFVWNFFWQKTQLQVWCAELLIMVRIKMMTVVYLLDPRAMASDVGGLWGICTSAAVAALQSHNTALNAFHWMAHCFQANLHCTNCTSMHPCTALSVHSLNHWNKNFKTSASKDIQRMRSLHDCFLEMGRALDQEKI